MKSISDKEIKHFFDMAKQEVPDRGFSQRVMHRLPQDQLPAYRWIVWFFGVVGLLIAWATGGLVEFFGYLATFGRTIAGAQLPNLSSVVIYLLVLGGMIGFSITIYKKAEG
jgi:hypothetical protein